MRAPVYVIHGDNDEQVDFSHGVSIHEAVHEAYKTEPYWVSGGGHNDIVELHREEYYRRLQGYFDSVKGYSAREVVAASRSGSRKRVQDANVSYEEVATT